jgi:aspartyl-tRNA(Asn)/glutamyl-tRNA(Gln) amidotransferase subunit A
MNDQLASLTIAEAGRLLSGREISPVALVVAHLERIKEFNPRLNAYITATPELALKQANQAEREIQRGEYKGPLHGIPLALKDLFETKGVRTTAGSSFFARHVPEDDAICVEKLKRAGAVLLGKLNMHEIALGVTNENPHFGDCHNPWDENCITGGSSGGNGAAIASGLCMGALGSDTGGSIRIPSALCGVVGLKPSRGRVSLRGVVPLSWNLDHVGPMARTAEDTALLLQAVAGYDPSDPWSLDMPVDDYSSRLDQGIQGWRIALADDEYFVQTGVVDIQVLEAVRSAARTLEVLGARVDAQPFPGAREAALANGLLTTSDAAAFHRQRLAEHPEGFGTDVRTRLQTGANYSSGDYALARRMQTMLQRQFIRFFDTFDLLLTPTVPITAPQHGTADAVERARTLTRFTAPFNLTGLPAISIPCGFSKAGLPIGMQLVAKPWGEAKLLRAAHAFEQARGFEVRVIP